MTKIKKLVMSLVGQVFIVTLVNADQISTQAGVASPLTNNRYTV